ncbi:MAG: TIR domain-containing protein [Pseudomonadales bacterium]
MSEPPQLQAYQGSEPFVFVSYSHADEQQVHPYLLQLNAAGFNIWFDQGIAPGHRWTQELAEAIERCSVFLLLATPRSVASEHCVNEVHFALNRHKPLLAVHLEPTELPAHLELAIGQRQAILQYQHEPTVAEQKVIDALTTLAAEPLPEPAGGFVAHAQFEPALTPRRRRWLPVGAGILALLLVGVGWWQGQQPSASSNSLAVLPFNNYTPTAQAYLTDGIADGLITQLGKLGNLRVASRASSFALKQELGSSSLNMAQIQERLQVRHILEGSISEGRTKEVLTVSVRMVDASADDSIWSAQWDTGETTIVDIQAEIALQVAQLLDPHLSQESQVMLGTRATENEAAYDSYLLGRDQLRQPRTQSVINAAEAHFTDAVAQDPDFAEAHAGLCETYIVRYAQNVDPIPFALAQKFCAQALQLHPELVEVRQSLGILYRYSGDYERSLSEFDRALAAAPDRAEIHLERALTLDKLGRQIQAESEIMRAIELEPGFWSGYYDLANFYYDHVQYDKALAVYEQVLDLVADDTKVRHSIAAVQMAKGDFDAALANYQMVSTRQDSPNRATLSNIGTTYYHMGCFEEAAIFQRKAVDVAPNDHRVLGRLAESCRFTPNGEAQARALWQRAIALANTDRDKSSWQTKGLLAIYHAHLGERDAAQAALDLMWARNPEASIGHFFAGIVQSRAGDEGATNSSAERSLELGFPAALLRADPDLGQPEACNPLGGRLPYTAAICSVDR